MSFSLVFLYLSIFFIALIKRKKARRRLFSIVCSNFIYILIRYQTIADSLKARHLLPVEDALPSFSDASVDLLCAERGTTCWKSLSKRSTRSFCNKKKNIFVGLIALCHYD